MPASRPTRSSGWCARSPTRWVRPPARHRAPRCEASNILLDEDSGRACSPISASRAWKAPGVVTDTARAAIGTPAIWRPSRPRAGGGRAGRSPQSRRGRVRGARAAARVQGRSDRAGARAAHCAAGPVRWSRHALATRSRSSRTIDRPRPRHGSPRSRAPRSGRGAHGGGRSRGGGERRSPSSPARPARACRLPRDAPARLAVMPFAVLGTPPYPATQLPEYFISRFRPWSTSARSSPSAGWSRRSRANTLERRGAGPRLSPGGEVLRAGKRRVRGPTVTLQATLYEGGRARRSAKAQDESAPRSRR